MLNLDQIEQDLVWARDNADRSAQSRLFVHHVPQMLTVLRALEVSQAQGDEEEKSSSEVEENPVEEGDGPEEQTGPEEEIDPSEEVDSSEEIDSSEEVDSSEEFPPSHPGDAEAEVKTEESTSIFPDED